MSDFDDLDVGQQPMWRSTGRGSGCVIVYCNLSGILNCYLKDTSSGLWITNSKADCQQRIPLRYVGISPVTGGTSFSFGNDIVSKLRQGYGYRLEVEKSDGTCDCFVFSPDTIDALDVDTAMLVGSRRRNAPLAQAASEQAVSQEGFDAAGGGSPIPADSKRSSTLIRKVLLCLLGLLLLALLAWGATRLFKLFDGPDSLEVAPKVQSKDKMVSASKGKTEPPKAQKIEQPQQSKQDTESQQTSQVAPQETMPQGAQDALKAGETSSGASDALMEQTIVSKSKRVALSTREEVRVFFKDKNRTPEAAIALSKTLSVSTSQDQDAVFRLYYFAAEAGVKEAFYPYAQTLDPNTKQWGSIRKDPKLALEFYRRCNALKEIEALNKYLEH